MLDSGRAKRLDLLDLGPKLRLWSSERTFRRFVERLQQRPRHCGPQPEIFFVGSGDDHHLTPAFLTDLPEPVIEEDDLPAYLFASSPAASGTLITEGSVPADLEAALAEVEKAYILAVLQQSNGVQAAAAQLIGISERSFWYRLKNSASMSTKSCVKKQSETRSW